MPFYGTDRALSALCMDDWRQVRRPDQREWQRFRVSQTISVDLSGPGRLLEGIVVDVSMGGARLKLMASCRVASGARQGTKLMLHHPRLEAIPAEAVWHAADNLGIRLDYGDSGLDFVTLCLRCA